MEKQRGMFEDLAITYKKMASPGLLLMSGLKTPNAMTIGWGTVGIVWGKPIFSVLVRPSRHSCKLLEEFGEFSVNVPSDEMNRAVAICGTESGRNVDKVQLCKFNLLPGETIAVPHIGGCPVVYECRVVQTNAVLRESFTDEIIGSYYPEGDFHYVYYGEILKVLNGNQKR